MLKVGTGLAIVALVMATGCVSMTTTTPAPSGPAPSTQVGAPAGSMVSLLNAARAEQGLGGVREDAALSRAAIAHAQDMVANDYFSHDGLNGSHFTERAQAAGYGCAINENIAFGQQSEAEVMTSWMNSPGHRRNILSPRATEYGIGRVGTMWVLMMGSGC